MFPQLSPLTHRKKRLPASPALQSPQKEYLTPPPHTRKRSLHPKSISPLGVSKCGDSSSPASTREDRRKDSFSRLLDPYGDSSIGSVSRRSAQVENSLHKFRHRRLKTLQAIDERERKKKLAELLGKKYGERFSRVELNQLSMEAMTQRAVTHRSAVLAKQAAKQLLTWLHRTVVAKGFAQVKARTHMAAFLIQQQWKRYKRKVVLPREALARRSAAAVVVQRWVRGHMARLKYRKRKVMRDVNCLHFHYERVRFRCLAAKAPIIQKSWRNYRMRKLLEALGGNSERAVERKPSDPAEAGKANLRSSPRRVTVDPTGQSAFKNDLRRMRTVLPDPSLSSDSEPPSSEGVVTRRRAGTEPIESHKPAGKRRQSVRFSSEEPRGPQSRSLEKSKSFSGETSHKRKKKRQKTKTKALARIDEIS